MKRISSRVLVALVLACVLGLTVTTAAWADESSNAVGEIFTIDVFEHGSLEFTITVAADADTAGAVKLTNAKTYQGDLALYRVERGGFVYDVNAVGNDAFKGNTSLTSVEFRSDLTGIAFQHNQLMEVFPAIGTNAFEGCTKLTTVAFPQKAAAIGNYAFRNCTSLVSITFAEGAELYGPVTPGAFIPAIGNYAFENCTALKEITIPAVTSAQRSPDYYGLYGGPDGEDNSIVWSSYFNTFGGGLGSIPTYRRAFGNGVFSNCSSLENVIFEPSGKDFGLFAYFPFGQVTPPELNVFNGCNKLKSVVYSAAQPWYADPDMSIVPGYTPSQHNVFQDSKVSPDLYYAVDYYDTTDEAYASGDRAYGSGRYARTAYLRGTPTAAIATGDVEALATAAYADAAAYAQDGYADGVIPDPQAVAEAAGLDANTAWVWKLGATQSRRAGLTDSCYAYLAPAADMSAGRVGAVQISTLYKLCGQNLSRGIDPVTGSPTDSLFDVARYYAGRDTYGTYSFSGSRLFLNEGETAWFTLDSTVEEGFFNQITVYAPDGTMLGPDDYDVTFERYDAAIHAYVEAVLGDGQDGPLLMIVTPGEDSGYTGVLREWVLVKGQAGSVRESYTASPTDTRDAAVYYNGVAQPGTSWYEGPYAVAIGSSDLTSALIASAYAGLTSAPISVLDTQDASYGFALATDFFRGTGQINGDLVAFRSTDRMSSEFAVAAYQAFEERQRDLLGATSELYPWGDTALLVSPASLKDVAAAAAAYAYAKRAPVFYTEDDGSVSDETLACLRDFDKVAVMGDEALLSEDAFDALEAALNGETSLLSAFFNALTSESNSEVELVRISGDAGSAWSLSLAVASILGEEGLADSSIVTVTDATDIADAIVALSLSGHEGGLTLVSACTADSKLISSYLHEQRDVVRVVRLFGRGASHMSSASFSLYNSLTTLWKESFAAPVAGEGDTLVLYGLQLEIGSDNELTFDDVRLWGGSGLEVGSYTHGGTVYTLAQAIEAVTVPPDDDTPDDDTPDDKAPGGLTVIPPPANSTQNTSGWTVVSGSGGATRNVSGTLVVSSFTVEEGEDAGASDDDDDEGTFALASADTPLDGSSGAQGSSVAGQQADTDPKAAAGIIGSAVSALGAALWFAMRRKGPIAALAEGV
jgi:hypothetical protein